MKPIFRISALLIAAAITGFSQQDANEAPVVEPEAPAAEPEMPEANAEDVVPEENPLLSPDAADDALGNTATAPQSGPDNMAGANQLLENLAGDVDISSIEGAEVVDFVKGIFRYKGGVNIKYRGVQILGEEAEFNRATGDIVVRNGVSIYRGGMLYKGTAAVYNIETDAITSDNLRTSLLSENKEIFFQTQELASGLGTDDVPELIETSTSMLTTHDSSHPNWQIQSKNLDIYPDDKLVFKNMRVYAGGTPVFWLPYLSQPMDNELGYTFSPGYDSTWGGYLLNRYGFLLGEDNHTLATFHLDLRSMRGIAAGLDFRSMRMRENPNIGLVRFYYANDLDPTISRNSGTRLLPPEQDRFRFDVHHRFYLGGYEDSVGVTRVSPNKKATPRSPIPRDDTFFVDADFNVLSDAYMLEDFYPGDFRLNPQPDNQLSLVKTNPQWSASLMGRFRINDFFHSDTRLPEAAIDFVRTPILGSNFYYEGSTAFGLIDEEIPDTTAASQLPRIERLRNSLENYESGLAMPLTFDPDATRTLLDDLEFAIGERQFTRFDSYHQVAYPFALGPLNLVPRVGLRYTHYSDISGKYADSADRALFHGGIDASLKFSREYDGVYSRALGLDGLRHVIQPYARYSVVTGDEMGKYFPAIDRLTPSTRPRPIDLGRYPATDTINNWNLARFGVFNRWQTKRDNSTYEWLTMNTYMDYFAEDPEFDREFSNLYWETEWRPLPWLSLALETQFDVMSQDQGFNEANTRLSWMPTPEFELSTSHRFLTAHPFLGESNQVTMQAFYRFADEWGFSASQRWELDDSTLETQEYSIHRDLVTWTAALGAVMRDNRGEDELGLVFTLTLKEFPQVALPLNFDPQGTSE